MEEESAKADASAKQTTVIDYLKFVSPGNPLRTVIDDLLQAELGALIVFDSPELHDKKIIEGGFRVNCLFSQQKLFELCKMDGAIIISPDLKRILYANVLLNPDISIYTSETGTRHKAAERTAKQSNTFTIAVSERRKKTTLYFQNTKYFLKNSEELLRNLSSTLQVLEKQREILDNLLASLSVLEMSELVSINDVCKVIQRAEMILKISEHVKRNFTELGKEGNIMHMRYRELLRKVEKIEKDIIKDYSRFLSRKIKTILARFTFDGLLDLEAIARLVFEKPLEESISPKGYRFLSHLTLSEKEIESMINKLKNLEKILKIEPKDFEPILKNRTEIIINEINNLREQILAGKVVI